MNTIAELLSQGWEAFLEADNFFLFFGTAALIIALTCFFVVFAWYRFDIATTEFFFKKKRIAEDNRLVLGKLRSSGFCRIKAGPSWVWEDTMLPQKINNNLWLDANVRIDKEKGRVYVKRKKKEKEASIEILDS